MSDGRGALTRWIFEEYRISEQSLAMSRVLVAFALLGMVNHTATWLRPGGRLTADQIADGYCDMILR